MKWRHYQSLGINCEAAFQFRRVLGVDHSALFQWNVTPIPVLKAMLASDLKGLGRRENLIYEGNGSLVRDRAFNYHFHWDGDWTLFPDRVPEIDYKNNIEKLAYLARKFDETLASGEPIVFFYTCQEPNTAEDLVEVAGLLRKRAARAKFMLVALRLEGDQTPNPAHPDIAVRRVKRFAPWADATDGHVKSWDAVFAEFPHEAGLRLAGF